MDFILEIAECTLWIKFVKLQFVDCTLQFTLKSWALQIALSRLPLADCILQISLFRLYFGYWTLQIADYTYQIAFVQIRLYFADFATTLKLLI